MESYSQHLMRRFTKDRIIEIGRFMGIRIPTQYIKQDCARYLEDSVVALPQILINALSLPDFIRLKEVISNGHVISDLLNDDYFLLSGVGVVGVEGLDGEGGEISVGHYVKKQYKITVPVNLIEPIKAVIDDLINDPLVIQTDKLEKAAIGIAVLYGILTDKIFVKTFNRLTNKSFTTLQLMSFVDSRRRLRQEIEYHFFNNTVYLATMLLKSPKPLIDYVKSRKDLEYFEFDIDEVVKASYDLYAEQTPELDVLRKEIIKRKINFVDALLFDVWNNTQNNDKIVDTIQMFADIFPFDGINELNMFIRKVTDYTNSIHKWELKGHSSNSLFKGEHLKSPFPPAYPPYPHAYPPPFSKVIGRNDPCPCGSGKKYKQCCGNN